MTRRLRTAGTAFGALLLPACAGVPLDTTALRPVSAIPPAPAPAPVAYRPMSASPATHAAKPRVVEKFAEGRPDAAPAVAQVPPPAPAPQPAPDQVASNIVVPAEHKAPAPAPAVVDPPRLILPVIGGTPGPEPKADTEGVIRPHWPVLKGVGPLTEPPGSAAADAPVLPPPSELMKAVAEPAVAPPVIPPAKADEAPAVAVDAPPVTPVVTPPAPAAVPTAAPPPALPPGVIGSSVHHSNASPVGVTPVEQALAGQPVAPAGAVAGGADSPLVRAVLAFQQNRPDEAIEHLKAYDAESQQVLLTLLPAMARLGQGSLKMMRPEEVDILLDQITRVPNLLRRQASLRADNVRLCREVHNFAHVQPFPDRHEFRPGDIVYLYMELANFSCVSKADPKDGFTVTLASSLELKDGTGVVVWRADPKEAADHVSTPPQDYYRNFRLCVPNVPPGPYTLCVKTVDRPTGREVCKAVELRVGAR